MDVALIGLEGPGEAAHGDAVHGLDLGRPLDEAARDVPLPGAEVAGLEREAQPAFAVAQASRERLSSSMSVLVPSHWTIGPPASRTGRGHALVPAVRAVGAAAKTKLDLVRVAGSQRMNPALDARRQIVRMDHGLPALAQHLRQRAPEVVEHALIDVVEGPVGARRHA